MFLGSSIVNQQWYRIELTKPRSNDREEAFVRRLFERAFVNHHAPADMSLWVERYENGCAALYISPIAVIIEPGLVHHTNAVRCTIPPASARLIAGSVQKTRLSEAE